MPDEVAKALADLESIKNELIEISILLQRAAARGDYDLVITLAKRIRKVA